MIFSGREGQTWFFFSNKLLLALTLHSKIRPLMRNGIAMSISRASCVPSATKLTNATGNLESFAQHAISRYIPMHDFRLRILRFRKHEVDRLTALIYLAAPLVGHHCVIACGGGATAWYGRGRRGGLGCTAQIAVPRGKDARVGQQRRSDGQDCRTQD